MQNIIFNNYAKAFLYRVQGNIENLLSELNKIHDVLSSVYSKLKIGFENKKIISILKEFSIDEDVKDIIIIMLKNKLVHILPNVIVEIQKIYFTKKKYTLAYINTYSSLNKKLLSSIKKNLSLKFKKQKIQFIEVVNKKLLWGFSLLVDNKTINFTGAYLQKQVMNI